MHVMIPPGQPAFSKAALAMNMRTPEPLGAAARLSAAYSALLRSTISSDRPSPSGKSAMHVGLHSGRTIALPCAVLGCEAEVDLLPFLRIRLWFFIT